MKTDRASATAVACDRAWSMVGDEVLAALEVDPGVGLSTVEANRRRSRYGPNVLRSAGRKGLLQILADQFRSIVIALLLAAALLALVFADPIDALAIFVVILINTTIGFTTEWRATRSMEALGRMGKVETVVVRDGTAQTIPAAELVPGDIVLREGGDIVTADMRLLTAAKLQADESTLTGESLPVGKSTARIAADAVLMDRNNMLFKGTSVTRGSARAIVIATGFDTELGRISTLVAEAEPERTPLELRLDKLARRLVRAVLVLAVAIGVLGVMTGRDTVLAIEVAIALAVAAIPEGLLIVATIALARGMWRMAKQNALISRLSAVETLGAASLILTDKTGTLTENRMTVTSICLAGDESMPAAGDESMPAAGGDERCRLLLETAALCNNASLTVAPGELVKTVGDPTEIALLIAAFEQGIMRDELLAAMPVVNEFAFDPDSKRMATVHETSSGTLIAVKGAPEAVIPLCAVARTAGGIDTFEDEQRASEFARAGKLGSQGLRTLAIARKLASDPLADACEDLEYLGLVGLEDPPRQGVSGAIRRCKDAGIRVLMVTGDHAATAQNIAEAVGIASEGSDSARVVDGPSLGECFAAPERLVATQVFSRVTPAQKLELIDWYQQRGEVVAMTGDGVNDAPALSKADIGVAMGMRGTAVAKEAAAMVLLDDDFRTIVDAVAQGRAIFENIRKFVVYLMSCNTSEVLIVAVATLAGAPLPLLPLQILFLNLVTDVFPALALGLGRGAPALMQREPRPASEPILTRAHWISIGAYGAVIAAAVFTAMAVAAFVLGFPAEKTVTVSFCTLALSQVWHVFNMRGDESRYLTNEVSRNPWVWGAVVLCVLLVLLAVYLPGMAGLLRLSNPGIDGWLIIVLMSLVPVATVPVLRRFLPRVSVPSKV